MSPAIFRIYKRHKILCFLSLFLTTGHGAVPDSSDATSGPLGEGPFLKTIRILHHPPEIMFTGRPYDLDLYVDFPRDSLEAVAVFVKTERMSRFEEIPLTESDRWYRHRYDPQRFPGATLQYFFLVQIKGKGLFATPLNPEGYIQPVKRTRIDPREYYQWKQQRYEWEKQSGQHE